MNRISRILLVEDDPKDVELTLLALEEFHLANEVVVVRDGAEALDFLFRRGTYADRDSADPVVVLLDLKLPKVGGIEVLSQVRANPDTQLLPIVVLTSSREDRDLIESYHLGVNAYLVKPVDFVQFTECVRSAGFFWAILNVVPPAGSRGTRT